MTLLCLTGPCHNPAVGATLLRAWLLLRLFHLTAPLASGVIASGGSLGGEGAGGVVESVAEGGVVDLDVIVDGAV